MNELRSSLLIVCLGSWSFFCWLEDSYLEPAQLYTYPRNTQPCFVARYSYHPSHITATVTLGVLRRVVVRRGSVWSARRRGPQYKAMPPNFLPLPLFVLKFLFLVPSNHHLSIRPASTTLWFAVSLIENRSVPIQVLKKSKSLINPIKQLISTNISLQQPIPQWYQAVCLKPTSSDYTSARMIKCLLQTLIRHLPCWVTGL